MFFKNHIFLLFFSLKKLDISLFFYWISCVFSNFQIEIHFFIDLSLKIWYCFLLKNLLFLRFSIDLFEFLKIFPVEMCLFSDFSLKIYFFIVSIEKLNISSMFYGSFWTFNGFHVENWNVIDFASKIFSYFRFLLRNLIFLWFSIGIRAFLATFIWEFVFIDFSLKIWYVSLFFMEKLNISLSFFWFFEFLIFSGGNLFLLLIFHWKYVFSLRLMKNLLFLWFSLIFSSF